MRTTALVFVGVRPSTTPTTPPLYLTWHCGENGGAACGGSLFSSSSSRRRLVPTPVCGDDGSGSCTGCVGVRASGPPHPPPACATSPAAPAGACHGADTVPGPEYTAVLASGDTGSAPILPGRSSPRSEYTSSSAAAAAAMADVASQRDACDGLEHSQSPRRRQRRVLRLASTEPGEKVGGEGWGRWPTVFGKHGGRTGGYSVLSEAILLLCL
eukprot:COSAG04_NODE_3336_length_2916_cov_1.844870_1_plen_213_part_00